MSGGERGPDEKAYQGRQPPKAGTEGPPLQDFSYGPSSTTGGRRLASAIVFLRYFSAISRRRSHLSLVIGFAADIAVRGGGHDGLGFGRRLIETGFEDVGDGGIAQCIDGQRPLAGSFQSLDFIASGQRQNAIGRAEALFGVRTIAHQ